VARHGSWQVLAIAMNPDRPIDLFTYPKMYRSSVVQTKSVNLGSQKTGRMFHAT
jgi:hypothetical protein